MRKKLNISEEKTKTTVETTNFIPIFSLSSSQQVLLISPSEAMVESNWDLVYTNYNTRYIN